jgi:hypothetical protein
MCETSVSITRRVCYRRGFLRNSLSAISTPIPRPGEAAERSAPLPTASFVMEVRPGIRTARPDSEKREAVRVIQ